MLADADGLEDDLSESELEDDLSESPVSNSLIVLHCSMRHGCHRSDNAVTSMSFSISEHQVLTASMDNTCRVWAVDTGHMLQHFTDNAPILVATFSPLNPAHFFCATSNNVLRLLSIETGMVLQKSRTESSCTALKFDDTGRFLFVGTMVGNLHVLDASAPESLTFRFKVTLGNGVVNCISFVPASNGKPPFLLVSNRSSSMDIIDCIYGPTAERNLTDLRVRHCVGMPFMTLPCRDCYSSSGQGYLISGFGSADVHICSLAPEANYSTRFLKHHHEPLVAVAANLQDTLLVSADVGGCIVLWRRPDGSRAEA